MMHDSKRVSAIIVNYNTFKLTKECVHSLLASVYPNLNIIIVDNSTDPAQQMLINDLTSDRVSVIANHGKQTYTAGVNLGLRMAYNNKAQHILVLNSDTIIDPDAVGYLVESMEKYGNSCIVSGKVYFADNPNVFQYIGGHCVDKDYLINKPIGYLELDQGQYDNEIEVDMLDDMFWLIPKGLFKCIGGYNEDFEMYAEQDDYVYRAKKAGFGLIYDYRAKIWHKGSASFEGGKNNFKRNYLLERNLLMLKYLHLRSKYFYKFFYKETLSIFWRDFVRNSLVCVKQGRKKDYSHTFARICGIFGFIFWMIKKNA